MAATALTTDLYELTMMAGYFASGRHDRRASFELFVRRLPPHRHYLIAAGLASLVDWLSALRFTDEEIRWLQASEALRHMPQSFFTYLRRLEFTGDLWAVPAGTPVFADEPIVRVTAPIAEAQLVETAALAMINFQTSIASKAARIVTAAGGRAVMEFGARRAHGVDAALFAARSAFLGGCAGTSLVEAGLRFDIPLSGTIAHSWVMAAASERQAFEEYARTFGGHSILLLDTYDTVDAAHLVVEAGLRPEERDGRAVRDILTPASASRAGARPLLREVMRNGRLVTTPPRLHEARSACAASLARLPPALLGLDPSEPYPVERD